MRTPTLALLSLVVLALAACGGEAASTTTAPTTTSPPQTTSTTTAETATTTAAETTSTTAAETTTTTTVETTTTTAAGAVIEVAVTGDEVTGGGRVSVPLGEEVTIRVTADRADEVHVHGYDLFADVAPDAPGEVTFTADVPGVFEVELESSHLPLLDLEVGG